MMIMILGGGVRVVRGVDIIHLKAGPGGEVVGRATEVVIARDMMIVRVSMETRDIADIVVTREAMVMVMVAGRREVQEMAVEEGEEEERREAIEGVNLGAESIRP